MDGADGPDPLPEEKLKPHPRHLTFIATATRPDYSTFFEGTRVGSVAVSTVDRKKPRSKIRLHLQSTFVPSKV